MLVSFTIALAFGQCAPTTPLSHAPISGPDAMTVGYGSFDEQAGLVDLTGSIDVKSTHTLGGVGSGIFGSRSLVLSATPGVSIQRSGELDSERGTVEMWVKVGAASPDRRYLFSARGAVGLDGDHRNDLFVGETSLTTDPFFSRIYFDDGSGLNFANPALVETVAPRGVAVGDVNGDNVLDLVIAENFADTLASPATSEPGEVHFYWGPITAGSTYTTPDAILEVDKPQGIVLADFDEHPGLDLVVGSFSNTSTPLFGFSNNGSGGFSPMNFAFGPFTASAEGLAAADVNDDGILDIVYASFDLNPSTLLLGQINNGDYELQPAPGQGSARSNQALGVAMADLDGDGDEDVVLAQTLAGDGQLAVHLNNGAGVFQIKPDCLIPTKRPFTVSAYRDLNNDGYLDIVVANWRDGLTTTVTSTVFFGPVTVPPSKGEDTPICDLPYREFLVDDAVSMTCGDLDGDGLDDLFFHSATADHSPIFYLDVDGHGKAGFVAGGKYLPSATIPTTPTKANPAGEGSGVHVATGGTSTYGSVHFAAGDIELYLEGTELVFCVTDRLGQRHSVSTSFPFGGSGDAENGFDHVQAEWSAVDGVVQLRVGDPTVPANVVTTTAAAYPMGGISPVFRIGSDFDNQRRFVGELDDVRVSTARRSELDEDGDGVFDDWDNCRYLANASQVDTDDDGKGDLCSTCQTDLGMEGAGTLVLSVCGQPLSPGNQSVIELRCGPPSSQFLLCIGFQSSPLPAFGGFLVPVPIAAVLFGALDETGATHLVMPAVVGGADLFLQGLAVDPADGVALSNAVRVTFPSGP